MGSQFEADLEAVTADMTAARADFVSAVQRLGDGDLERGRRGGWPVRRVLEHVIQSEQLYAALIGALRGLPVGQVERPSCAGQAATEILCLLDSIRTALLLALDGV